MSSTNNEATLITCVECGKGQECGPIAQCTYCGSNQVRRGVRFQWTPWDYHGKRIDGVLVPVLAVKSRKRDKGGHTDVLCEMIGGEGERWFSEEQLLESPASQVESETPAEIHWVDFDKTQADEQPLPPERRDVLVLLQSTGLGLPKGVAVGYLRFAAGCKDSPYFVVPGIGGEVDAWCDCLGDGVSELCMERSQL